jgi:hypothetical protein
MRNERRMRRLCLIAVLVLLPVTLWTDAREDVVRAWTGRAFRAINVEPTQRAPFAGLQWQLLGLDATDNVKMPGRTEVVARLQLDLSATEAVQSLRDCQPYLEDSSGQRWSPLAPQFRQISCSQLSWRAPANSKEAVVTERFIIPTERVADVRLAIVMKKEQPQYLRFDQPAP